ncbi:ATP-binding protein [Actinomadura logoneensis]|uniref:ATP-binding protein n=2 Tax=Actinomadura logoneensis TaxID=2293572 RepID=A0A372JQI7_9ACTN|nr:ATP-binding protein [Actinomadura logoneensis]
MQLLGEELVLTGGRTEGQALRRTVRERAAKLIDDPELLDDVELMGAEALANAVLHGSEPIRVRIAADGRRLRVAVRDGGPARRGDPHGTDRIDHGRGLAVIDVLASEWGLEQSATGTYLWFDVDLPGAKS